MQGVPRTKEEIETIKAEIVKLMNASVGGTFTAACQVAEVGISEAYTWRKEDPDFDIDVQAAWKRGKNNALDMAESKLIEAVQASKTAELLFFLKTQGKQRGYIERTEQDHGVRDGASGTFTITTDSHEHDTDKQSE